MDEIEKVARALYIDEYSDATEFDKGRGCEVPTMMRRAKAAITAIDECRGWRPIESAPNGKLVLVCCDCEHGLKVQGARMFGGHWRSGASNNYLSFKPTHFQPLPQPPKAEAVKGGE